MVRPKHARQADPAEQLLQQEARRTTRSSTVKTPPVYGDHSSTYWSPGWNYKRYTEASPEELAQVPESEMEKMRAGIREALGEHGAGMWVRHLYKEKRKKEMSLQDLVDERASASSPGFVTTYQRRVKDGPWGFVAIRTVCYDDEDKWNRFKTLWDNIVRLPFRKEEGKPGVKEVEAKFEIRWVEDKTFIDGVEIETLRQKYTTLYPTLSGGLQQPVFLNINAEVVNSVLENETPTTDSAMWRPDAPFVIVIPKDTPNNAEGKEGEEEGEDQEGPHQNKNSFKVAVEILADQFWDIVASDITPLRNITRTLGEDDIWWSNMSSPRHVRKRRRVLGE